MMRFIRMTLASPFYVIGTALLAIGVMVGGLEIAKEMTEAMGNDSR